MYKFEVEPFKPSTEQLGANLVEVKNDREEFYAEYGRQGSDGILADALANAGNRWMDNTEEAILGAIEGLQNLGTLAICAPGILRDKLSGK